MTAEVNCVFDDHVLVEITFLDRSAVHYIVDSATGVSAATPPDTQGTSYGLSENSILLAVLMTRCLQYAGYPIRLGSD